MTNYNYTKDVKFNINNFSYLEFCETPRMKDKEYCFHEPTLEIVFKVGGKKHIPSEAIGAK